MKIHEQHPDVRIVKDVAKTSKRAIARIVRKDDRSIVENLDCWYTFPFPTVAAIALALSVAGGDEEEIERFKIMRDTIRDCGSSRNVRC